MSEPVAKASVPASWGQDLLFGGPSRNNRSTRVPSSFVAAYSAEEVEIKLMAPFRELVGKIYDLNAVAALLEWDTDQNLPEKASGERGKEVATVAEASHQLMTSPRMTKLISDLHVMAVWLKLSDRDKALLARVTKQVEQERKLPAPLVRRLSELATEGFMVWREAKQAKDFKRFEPVLSELVALQRQKAQLLSQGGNPYDALLDQYEPGMTTAQLDPMFAELKQALVPLVKQLAQSGKKSRVANFPPPGPYHKGSQQLLNREVLERMGFDFSRGRLDESVHPYCAGSSPNDVRLTTKYVASDPFDAFFSTLHEGGHGLVEQGMDPAFIRTPLMSATMGIHESQSRLWENLVGRSRPFWQFYAPIFRKAFPDQFKGVRTETFYQAMNQVKPSMIRIESDEVTYNLHILMRYELERDMINGKLAVKDLPAAWNKKMQEYLGITPAHDGEGVLQDVHWSSPMMGYFPTYTLGNLYSAQFFDTAKQEIPNLERQLAAGNFKPLKKWLNEKIHRYGQTEEPAQTVARVTGQPPNPKFFIRYLQEKYTGTSTITDMYPPINPDDMLIS
jgi:carboxypeptidase Taq